MTTPAQQDKMQAEQQAASAEAEAVAADWSDYRRDYGVPTEHMEAAHKAFRAGWKAGRHGEQSGVLR